MRQYYESIRERVDAALEKDRESTDPVSTYRECVRVLEQGLDEIRTELAASPFEKREEEVAFYKYDAPEIHGLLFFCMKLVKIRGAKKYLGREKYQEVLNLELLEVENYMDKHSAFCQYYFENDTARDDYYFTRRGRGEWSAVEVGTYIHEDFTLGASLASWVLAYERLRKWIEAEMEDLEQSADGPGQKKKLPCTARPVEVVEVFKSLHLAGWFGTAPFKEVMDWVREYLGVNVGNHDIILQEISNRKISRTKCLDGATEGLLAWLDKKL